MGPNSTARLTNGSLAAARSAWDPFRDLDEWSRRVFGRPVASGDASAARWTPAVDIAETDAEYAIRLDLPGLDRKQVSVVVEDGMLVVSGERTVENEHRDAKVHRVERAHGAFSRRFRLPEDADDSAIAATFRNGVLAIALPKTPESKPRRIDVEVG